MPPRSVTALAPGSIDRPPGEFSATAGEGFEVMDAHATDANQKLETYPQRPSSPENNDLAMTVHHDAGKAVSKGLEVKNLRKRYGDLLAVDDLSFSVNRGEVLGIIGPNGAGKTTCMLVIMGLLKADEGSITLDGHPYDPRDPAMRSMLGIVPQEIAIYPDLTASQNLRFFGRLYGLRGARLEERIEYILDLTGLTDHANNTPSMFSGGMSRRLNFGIALLHEPQFVILDEPTVGIDPQSRSSLLDCVRQLSKRGVGVLYASHYMEEIEAVCQRVAIIDHGRMLRIGRLEELLSGPGTELCVRVGSLSPELLAKLRSICTVHTDAEANTTIIIHEELISNKELMRGRLRKVLDILDDAEVSISAVETSETSLETLFLALTGRRLRD